MRSPLAFRVVTADGPRTLTRRTSGLEFTKTAPGGHESARARIDARLDDLNLDPTTRVQITDTRTGGTVWDGYADNPGRQQTNRQGFDLSAQGGQILAADQSRKLIYLDKSLESWQRDDLVAQAASAGTDVSSRPTDGLAAILLQFNPGQPVTTGSRAQMVYNQFIGSGMTLGAYGFTEGCGQADSNYSVQSSVGGDATYIQQPYTRTMNTSFVAASKFAQVNFDPGHTRISLRLIRGAGGATNVATDNVWAAIVEVRVAGQRLNLDGTNVILDGTVYVLAHQVVTDLVARMLPGIDPTTATIETTTFQIDQLVYPDPVRASTVLDDLSLFEPDMLWEILDAGPDGRHRFNYRAWPTTARYAISTRDGYSAPGGEQDLCNRVVVGFTDVKGVKRSVTVSVAVDALDRVGRIRYADPITLDDNPQVAGTIGSDANAQRIGEQLLAQKNAPGLAATATVGRPVVDLASGSLVRPWEIEPGYLVRVRETGEDLRLTEVSFSDDDVAATLRLGTPVRSFEQLVAGVQAQRRSA